MTGLFIVVAGLMDATVASPKPILICREGEQSVGTHIHSGRRCLTAEQWLQEDLRRGQMPATLHLIPDQGDGLPRPKRHP